MPAVQLTSPHFTSYHPRSTPPTPLILLGKPLSQLLNPVKPSHSHGPESPSCTGKEPVNERDRTAPKECRRLKTGSDWCVTFGVV